MKSYLRWIAVACLIWSTPNQANQNVLYSETDPYTLRFSGLEDITDLVNGEINRRLQVAIQNTNAKCIKTLGNTKSSPSKKCQKQFELQLSKQFRRIFYGKVEGWVNTELKSHVKRIPISESIYQFFGFFDNLPARLGKMGFGSVFKLNGEVIGSDKLGHFLDEGWTQYSLFRDTKSLPDAIQYGVNTEEGFFGLVTTGVKSYADMVANYQGMFFWDRVMGTHLMSHAAPYVVWTPNGWSQVGAVDLRSYVDAAWDEGINCNQYRSRRLQDKIESYLTELSLIHGVEYHCPMETQRCAGLVERYGVWSDTLLHPRCLQAR